MQTNPNRKIYIIAATLWLVVIGVGVGFFMLGGLKLVTPDYVSLRSVYMTSANDGWAAGVTSLRDQGNKLEAAFFHHQNGSWQEYPVVTSRYDEIVSVISMSSADEGWAASASDTIMFHYKSGKWTEVPAPLDSTIVSISTLAANDVWAVAGDTVAHYNGSSWLTQTVGSKIGLKSIQMLSADEGWAVGGNVILHYKNGKWSEIDGWNADKVNTAFDALDMLSPTEGWAVGEVFLDKPFHTAHSSGNMTVEGVVYHFHNGTWTKDSSFDGSSYSSLSSIAMVSPNEGWMVGDTTGEDIKTVILHYDKGQWSPSVTYNLEFEGNSGLSMLSPNEGWAVFGKHILHYQDGGWHE